MADTEKLDLILAGMQQINQRLDGLDKRIDGLDKRIDGLDKRIDGLDKRIIGLDKRIVGLETQMSQVNQRMDGLELQIESSQRVLKNEIKKSEALIFDEVERVHMILDRHKQDETKHIA